MVIKILFVADSHGRNVADTFRMWDPTAEIMAIWRPGAKVNDLITMVRQQKERIKEFVPQHIFVMTGHNMVNFHYSKNATPDWCKQAIDDIFGLISLLHRYVPDARRYFSSLFPRQVTRHYSTTQAQGYNIVSKRMTRYAYQIVRNAAIDHYREVEVIEYPELWQSLYKGIAIDEHYDKDGLHLLPSGKKLVTRSWYQACVRPFKYNYDPTIGAHQLKVKH